MSDQVLEPGPTAGALLREAREAAGLHVAALAVSLKVPVRKLEALEGDRYDLLPDAVFARALASSVCRSLKIDPQPVLQRLPQHNAPRLVQTNEGLNAPFRAPGDVVVPAWREHLTRPASVAVGALLLGAVAILLLPSTRREEAPVTARPEAAAAPMATPVLLQPSPAGAEPPVAVNAPGSPAVAPTASPAAASPEAGGAKPPAAGAAAVPAAAVAPAAAPAPADASTTAAAPASGLIVFRTSGPSWVEVVDSRGQVPLRRLLAAGETVGASGTPPLAVTVGSANTTAVEVRGKRFDLAPLARDNVARFEVK